ncbi:MAG TPA: hypothetical protein VIH40_10285 [Xanthobacteraceae bacterium]
MSEERREDAAWVRIATKLSPAALAAFCQDGERLLRINSLYEFEDWRPHGDGRFFMRLRNLSNGRTIETPIRLEPRPDGLRIAYEAGIKRATEFHVERASPERGEAGAALIIIDDYSGTPEAERRARADEVDTSLRQWGADVHRYLRQWARWSHFGPWRWYMRRIWQPMRPMARRVTFLLIVITLAEFAAFLMVIAIFWLELLRVGEVL